MSNVYVCDECGKQMGEPEITVSGLRKTSGNILLPSKFLEYDFCSIVCMLKAFGLSKVQVETKE